MDNPQEIVKKLHDAPDLVDILIGVENYFDSSDLYVFKNWIEGELIAGPFIEPYWIKVSFLWPFKKMPDPAGGLRLLQHGTRVHFHLDYQNVPQPILKPSDYKPGTHKPKIKKEKVWVVDFMIPRRFIETVEDSVMDLYNMTKDKEGNEAQFKSEIPDENAREIPNEEQ